MDSSLLTIVICTYIGASTVCIYDIYTSYYLSGYIDYGEIRISHISKILICLSLALQISSLYENRKHHEKRSSLDTQAQYRDLGHGARQKVQGKAQLWTSTCQHCADHAVEAVWMGGSGTSVPSALDDAELEKLHLALCMNTAFCRLCPNHISFPVGSRWCMAGRTSELQLNLGKRLKKVTKSIHLWTNKIACITKHHANNTCPLSNYD